MSIREWKIWHLAPKNRLETYALIITFLFALYKIDTGYFSAGVSVEPSCKMVETKKGKLIVGTLKLTGDKDRKVIILNLETIILAGGLEVKNLLTPNGKKSQYSRQAGDPQSCVFNGLNFELEYVKKFGKVNDKFLFKNGKNKNGKNKIISISPGDKVVFECIGNVTNYPSDDGLYTLDFRIAVERAGWHLQFVNWLSPNKYKERRATCVVAKNTKGRLDVKE